MSAVHQVLASLAYGDAIGHEVLGIQRVLRHAGYESRIYVEDADPLLEPRTEDYLDLLDHGQDEDILIHHFSIGSKASRVAYALPARMVLVYHNITPPAYFIGVNPTLVQLCWSGRRELRAYATRCALALGDSEFNRRELDALGFPQTGVLPVVPDFSHLQVGPNAMMADAFDDDRTNILFVGRMIPNKRIEDLIRFFQAYRLRYDPRARLILVGSHGGFEEYVTALFSLTARLRVPDVHIFGHVSDAELTALYDTADVFLSASEHEGFCVPLVEAFHKGVPVIAFAATAVPDTMDGGGVLYERKDPRHVASLIHMVVSDEGWRREVIRAQDRALVRLRQRDFGETLLRYIDQVRHGPAPVAPAVTPDFWQQVQLLEELEQIRAERPSAYQALPRFRPPETE